MLLSCQDAWLPFWLYDCGGRFKFMFVCPSCCPCCEGEKRDYLYECVSSPPGGANSAEAPVETPALSASELAASVFGDSSLAEGL